MPVPLVLMSVTSKSAVASLEVKVIASVESFEVSPSETFAAVMVMVRLGHVVAPPSLIVQPEDVIILALAVWAAEQPVYCAEVSNDEPAQLGGVKVNASQATRSRS